jgi:peptidyl-prolyl cis-trans isomerase SurA
MRRLLTISAFLLAALTVTATAERQLIDRIVAVVEDEAIFASDIEAMVRQYMMQQEKESLTPSERSELEQEVLQSLINDKLVIAEANRLDISIPFEEVEKQVNKAIDENRQMLGGEEAFERQLAREGFTLDSLKKLYRQQVHNRMLVERVLASEMRKGRGEITDEELRNFYEERKDDLPLRPEVVHLKTIFIGFETASNARQAAEERIQEIHDRIVAGEAFADMAREYSDDPSGQKGGDLGFLRPDDLRDPTFAATASSLEVGEVSEPVLTSYGYHLIQVTERRPETGEIRISHILVRVQPSESDITEVFQTATMVQQGLMAGASFDSLASRYNTDPTTDAVGDLGWLKVSDLPEFFRDVLAGMRMGDVSQVLRESNGFRIVKLVGRESERPYRYAEVEGELRNLYQQQYMSNAYDEYVAKLHDKFTVDLKTQ